MNWIATTLLSAFFIALSNVLAKIYQSKIALGIGLAIFAIGVFVIAFITTTIQKTPVVLSKSFQQAAMLAFLYGVIWAIGQVFFLLTLSKNAPLSLTIPILVGCIAIGGVISGLVFFKETLSSLQIIGVITVLIGTVILSR
ncbi:MAG TPA: hypothetical protein VJB96_00195 [Patescibacteria group bacterium]|nr:hypothetical protein [Patescibacteria group bacterium]